MTHVPHELHDEFPELADRIHQLKAGDPQFVKLADLYHELNQAVHRMEADVEPVSDEVLEDFKKRRLAAKDQIFARLRAPAA